MKVTRTGRITDPSLSAPEKSPRQFIGFNATVKHGCFQGVCGFMFFYVISTCFVNTSLRILTSDPKPHFTNYIATTIT